MATSRFSLTLFWPMNSWRRCGRSLSSKEESSSTGAAETRRSLRCSAGWSLAADTEGDGSSSEFWVPSLVALITRDAMDRRRNPAELRSGLDGRGGRPYTSFHCPITPNRTPFSLPASNHATLCPNQVFVPESLYFLVAAAKSRVASR